LTHPARGPENRRYTDRIGLIVVSEQRGRSPHAEELSRVWRHHVRSGHKLPTLRSSTNPLVFGAALAIDANAGATQEESQPRIYSSRGIWLSSLLVHSAPNPCSASVRNNRLRGDCPLSAGTSTGRFNYRTRTDAWTFLVECNGLTVRAFTELCLLVVCQD